MGESGDQSQVCLILESTFNHYISLWAHLENFTDSVDWNRGVGVVTNEGDWIGEDQRMEGL